MQWLGIVSVIALLVFLAALFRHFVLVAVMVLSFSTGILIKIYPDIIYVRALLGLMPGGTIA